MKYLSDLIKKNRQWASNIKSNNPSFFKELSASQNPRYLWIGCADSRIAENEILGASLGDIFVHRNIANVIVQTDLNLLSVVQYAVEVLQIQDILVCGHSNCGGIKAAMSKNSYGIIDNWLKHIQNIHHKYERFLESSCIKIYEEKRGGDIDFNQEKYNLMCKINVVEQVINLAKTTVIQNAWEKGEILTIHGCIYELSSGLLNQLASGISSNNEVKHFYNAALAGI